MKSVLAIALCALVATSALAYNSDEMLTSLAEMEKSPFLHSVISTISIQLNTGGPIEDIIEMLRDVKDALIGNQKREDKAWGQASSQCKKDKATFSKQIKDLKAEIQKNTAALRSARKRLANASKTLSGELLNNKKLRGTLKSETQARKNAHKVYLGHVKDNKNAIGAIKEAIDIFSGLLVSKKKSFLQVSKLQSLQEKISVFLEKNSHLKTMYGPIIASLVQIASKADQKTVKKILALMERLRHALRRSLNDEHADEKLAQKNWKKRSHFLRLQISLSDSKIRSLRNRIRVLKTTIKTLVRTLANNRKDLAQARIDLASTTKWCKLERDNYFNVRSNRNTLLNRVDQLLSYVKNNVATIASTVKARVNK